MPHILGMHIGEIPHEPISERVASIYAGHSSVYVCVYVRKTMNCLSPYSGVWFEKNYILGY